MSSIIASMALLKHLSRNSGFPPCQSPIGLTGHEKPIPRCSRGKVMPTNRTYANNHKNFQSASVVKGILSAGRKCPMFRNWRERSKWSTNGQNKGKHKNASHDTRHTYLIHHNSKSFLVLSNIQIGSQTSRAAEGKQSRLKWYHITAQLPSLAGAPC
jgi:hypothetical protein